MGETREPPPTPDSRVGWNASGSRSELPRTSPGADAGSKPLEVSTISRVARRDAEDSCCVPGVSQDPPAELPARPAPRLNGHRRAILTLLRLYILQLCVLRASTAACSSAKLPRGWFEALGPLSFTRLFGLSGSGRGRGG